MSGANEGSAENPLHANHWDPNSAEPLSGEVSASGALVSWPVAVQCARDRVRSGPVIAFAALLSLTELSAGRMRSGADVFGGGAIFSQTFLLCFTLALGAAIIAEEVDSGHAQLVLLRPLSRAAFFGGRLAGAGLVLLAGLLLAFAIALACIIGAARFSPEVLLALPVNFVWAFAWLALLAALSTVARGSGNTAWMLIGAVLWLTVKFGLMGASALATATHRWPFLGEVYQAASAVLPYLGPQNPNGLLEQIAQSARPDFGPLLYDLLWIALSWTAGAYLFSRRELARRRA
jgi:hypothetical protein